MDNVQVPYKVKRLFIDIETSLIEAGTFSLFPNYINHQTIFKDWYIICAAWKWEGRKTVYSAVSIDGDDKSVLEPLCKAIESADEVVYHNGKKFDFKKLHARVVYHRLPPVSKPTETDTLIQARKYFGFTSNKLDYLAGYLNVGAKLPTDIMLWVNIRNKDKKALRDMVTYNKHDVVILEGVYKVLKPYIDSGYNYNIGNGLGDRCPSCGSPDLQKWGFKYTLVSKYQRFRCNSCGHLCQEGAKQPNKGVIRINR